MSKVYVVDGHQVSVAWTYRTSDEDVSAVVYALHLDGVPLATTIAKTRLGSFRAHDSQGRLIGTFPTLHAAVKGILRVD